MRFVWASILLLFAVALLAPAAHAGEGEAMPKSYIGGTGAAAGSCATALGPGLSRACFPIPVGLARVHVDIADETGLRIRAEWQFRMQSGALGPRTFFCDETRIEVPPDAEMLLIHIHMATAALECTSREAGIGGPATTGTVTARFT